MKCANTFLVMTQAEIEEKLAGILDLMPYKPERSKVENDCEPKPTIEEVEQTEELLREGH